VTIKTSSIPDEFNTYLPIFFQEFVMSAKHTALIWQADLARPLKLVALALADNANTLGIVPLDDKKRIAWLTGYSVEELDKALSILLSTGVLVQMPEMQVRFSVEAIAQMKPYWLGTAAAYDEEDPETIQTLQYQLKALHIQPETVEELVQQHPAALILEWITLYKQAVAVGLADGSGYLVSALRRNWDMEAARQRIETRRKKIRQQAASQSLPDELKEYLQKMGWEDDLGEMIQAYQDNPDRTLGWAKYTVKEGWGAGKFRKSLRSGLMAPNHEPVLRPPVAILENAEKSSQDDWYEPSSEVTQAWQTCLSQIALMGTEERGFNSGDFASWLEPAKPISMECTGFDTRFTVKSCTPTAADWIEQYARGLLEDVLGDVLNRSVSLESVS
jgi:hypothetical protein